MTDREQALVDLDAGVRRERERVARRIYAVEFRSRRDSQGLAELTWVKGECRAGAQHPGLWRDSPGEGCAIALGVQTRRVSDRQGDGQ